MLVDKRDMNDISESYFWLSMAHASLESALSAIGMAKIHAGKGNVELQGIDEITDTLNNLSEPVAEIILDMGAEFFGNADE